MKNLESMGLSQPVLDSISKVSKYLNDTPMIHYSNLIDRSVTFVTTSSNGNKRIEIKRFDIQNYQGIVLSSQIEMSPPTYAALNFEFGNIQRHAVKLLADSEIKNRAAFYLIKDVERTLLPSI